MNLDHCADTSRNVTGLWEGKQDNECRLVIRYLKVKGNTLGCCFPSQAMCISGIHSLGLLRGYSGRAASLCLSICVPEAPVMLFSICSPSMLLTFLPVESSLLQWRGRGTPQDQYHALCQHQGFPGISRLHVCVLQCYGKHRFPSQVFQKAGINMWVPTHANILKYKWNLLSLAWVWNYFGYLTARGESVLIQSLCLMFPAGRCQTTCNFLQPPWIIQKRKTSIKMIEAGNTL